MKLLIFRISDREYALDIKNVIRVIRMRQVISIAQAADFIEGVIAWQQKVIALINLRKKFMLGGALSSSRSRFIILNVNNHLMGVIVDNVIEVLDINQANIEPANEVFKETTYLSGVLKSAKRIILIMDTEKLFSSQEQQSISVIHSRVAIKEKA